MNICERKHTRNDLLLVYPQSHGDDGVNDYILILEQTIHTLGMWFNFYLFMLQKFAGGCKYQMELLMNETW